MVDADLDKGFAFDSCWTLEGREMLVGLISPPVTDHTCDKLQKGIKEIFLSYQGGFQKCIEYIGKFLIQMWEILKFW